MPTTKDLPPLLAFGAHPDDIEFGAGGVIATETRAGRPAHFVVCSRGEAGTHGTPAVRTREAKAAARILGATIEFLALDGDAKLELKAAHALKLTALETQIALVHASVPTATSAYILASRMNGRGAPVALVISSGTMLAVFTMPLWLALVAR